MTLSMRVSIAKKNYYCDNCGKFIRIGEEYVRHFGSSDDRMINPKPYMLRGCVPCYQSEVTYWHETHKSRRTVKAAEVAERGKE